MFFLCLFYVFFKAADDAMEAESEVSLWHMLSGLPVNTIFWEIQGESFDFRIQFGEGNFGGGSTNQPSGNLVHKPKI